MEKDTQAQGAFTAASKNNKKHDGQGTQRRRKIVDNFKLLSRVHQRYRQPDDRQTESEREFTFAKKLKCIGFIQTVCQYSTVVVD